jgi:2-dehydropantoate 2-reductase
MGGARILVVGCGAIGGVTAAQLVAGGHQPLLLTTNARIASAIREHGILSRGPGAPATPQRAEVIERVDGSLAPFDYVLLATQPPEVERAAQTVLPLLAPRGRMVCFQNGLCEQRIAAICGAERVAGAVVAWGASVLSPGVYERTSPGGHAIGYLDGRLDSELDRLQLILQSVGPVQVTRNLAGVRWSKLAINSAISTLGTIGGDRLGVLMKQRRVRRLALEIMSEAIDVARAERIQLEKIDGTIALEWLSLDREQRRRRASARLMAKHGLLLAVGARYRRLRSSMLSAIERGRKPAVDFLNGEVVSRAARHQIQVPVNAAAQRLVWQIARGQARACHGALHALYDCTR